MELVYQEPPDREETPARRFVLVPTSYLFDVFLLPLALMVSRVFQGVAGAEGSPGKDGLLGDRVRGIHGVGVFK